MPCRRRRKMCRRFAGRARKFGRLPEGPAGISFYPLVVKPTTRSSYALRLPTERAPGGTPIASRALGPALVTIFSPGTIAVGVAFQRVSYKFTFN